MTIRQMKDYLGSLPTELDNCQIIFRKLINKKEMEGNSDFDTTIEMTDILCADCDIAYLAIDDLTKELVLMNQSDNMFAMELTDNVSGLKFN